MDPGLHATDRREMEEGKDKSEDSTVGVGGDSLTCKRGERSGQGEEKWIKIL